VSAPPITGTLVACRSVSVVHGHGETAVTALADVELAIGPAEVMSLTGRSGSGKTTLLHVLGGLIEPSSGEVLLEGEPLSSLDAAARGRVRARSVAYVFQGANLLSTFTAFENVSFALHVTAAEHGDGERNGAAELLELVGLDGKLDNLPAELSGGEAQRVAIARALAQRPALLLCDEPTGHLDSDTGTRVLDLIMRLQEELGFALVLATHDADVAARAARVITLEDGRVIADGGLE
jgi:predicted ABC-type transport system involved in lysophospholipase L1 biosynthesis ATPase subunit